MQALIPIFMACFALSHSSLAGETISSPDGQIQVTVDMDGGAPRYSVTAYGQLVLEPSALGLVMQKGHAYTHGFEIARVSRSTYDETWEQPWGEERFIRSRFNELRIELRNDHRMDLAFRVFNDGFGFRYEIPEQEGLEPFIVTEERTEFAFAKSRPFKAWWIPAYHDLTYELLYTSTSLSEIPTVHTPLTLESDGIALSLHEAALVDYPSMVLKGDGARTLRAELVPGIRIPVHAPFVTPWRTVQIGRTPAELLTSYLILNLNEPSRLADTSWIRPRKYMGIWWGMHRGDLTWGSGPNRGATTFRARQAIEAAATLRVPALLIEGWNQGWDGDWVSGGSRFSFTEPNPEFDLFGVAQYARERGVSLIGHHETAGAISNYERQLEDAFTLYKRLGIETVKTGYVGRRVENGEWHYGERMVRHHQKVVEAAVRHRIMLDVHEPVKDTGLRRTYPNLMTREGARGTEFDAWSGLKGNPPNHTTILPFTRGLSGPLDFTPGIFDLTLGRPTGENRVRTTLAKQLALYVVIYSPLQMAADLPENYSGVPAFQFIQDVPVDWHTTRVLNGAIGEFVTIARRDRASEDWYLGSITNEISRDFEIQLDFLSPSKTYCAKIYRDSANAHWERNPGAYEIVSERVTSRDTIRLHLAPGGGQAIQFRVCD